MAGELHAGDEGNRDRGADQATTERGQPQGVGHGKQGDAGSRDDGRCGGHAARADGVGEQAAGDLHGGIGIEIDGGEIAEQRGGDAEIAHQLVDHHRRRDALEEADEIEAGKQAPGQPGQRDGR
ncbi:MAG: hypothetical protein A2X71_05270 [Thiobacillus sp. GWE1_62_9]|nr:MAG: hypothetical protein A2X71_05270 [Thiobacillus sp. GWE1_62_9]